MHPDQVAPEKEASNGGLGEEWEAALAEQAKGGEFARASYDRLEEDEVGRRHASEDINLDVILDVPVTLSMEIGRTRISIRNLLQLNQGSVVELDRLAGEPMDVMVNGTLIARGEVVVVNDKFGIRLTDIISPAERVHKLK
ncbi:MAG: flagellar motor switch protein FliN [Methylohalobius sp.]|nr:flagellar motor switch protein FliN [Methylohalobius sp.]